MSSQFGALLRQLRQRAGLTQESLADRSALGVRTIRGLETGERADPRLATVRQLADALELDQNERIELLAAAGHAPLDPAPAVPDGLAEAAGRLAHAVRARWQREEEQRQIHDPFPLPVRWRPVPTDLTDSWANIRRARAGATARPLDLTGQLDQIVDVYRRVPSRRLVVLGRAGSGKTILTLRFVLDLLRDRAAGDPVPVIFGLGAWNPTLTPFRDWLIDQLLRDHPGLAAPTPDGPTLAAALVETDRILPVLDGFDEIADGLRRAALEALNTTTLPLLLTSRPDEYAAAVARTDVLTAAGGVELTALTVADLAGYLPRTTRRFGRAGELWQPVLHALHEPAGANLARVLATPLMVGLARTIYSDTPDHDPAELLDTDRFPTAAAIEEHLLACFVPTVYRYQPENRRFDPGRAQHWLGYLAHHLTRLDTHDLAWWRLGASVRRPVRLLAVVVTVGLLVTFVDLVVEWLVRGPPTAHEVVFAAMLGPVAGLAFGCAHALLLRSTNGALEPSRVRLRVRGHPARPDRRRRVWHRTWIGFVSGLVLGGCFGLARELLRALVFGQPEAPVVGVVDAVLFGLVFGFGGGLGYGLLTRWEAPLDVESVGGPIALLRANRATVLVQVLLFGVVFALVVPLSGWLAVRLLQRLPAGTVFGIEFFWDSTFGLILGLVCGIGGGAGYALALTAWGQWLVFARLWLPLTGRLPWALPAFLDDAYRRGVLRRAGAVYQFRHARLRDHLTNAHPAR